MRKFCIMVIAMLVLMLGATPVVSARTLVSAATNIISVNVSGRDVIVTGQITGKDDGDNPHDFDYVIGICDDVCPETGRNFYDGPHHSFGKASSLGRSYVGATFHNMTPGSHKAYLGVYMSALVVYSELKSFVVAGPAIRVSAQQVPALFASSQKMALARFQIATGSVIINTVDLGFSEGPLALVGIYVGDELVSDMKNVSKGVSKFSLNRTVKGNLTLTVRGVTNILAFKGRATALKTTWVIARGYDLSSGRDITSGSASVIIAIYRK